MRTLLSLCLCAALPAAAWAAAPWKVEVTQVADGDFAIVVTQLAAGIPPETVQAELLPVATQVCGSRAVRFGRYRFESSKPSNEADPANGEQRFEQSLQCRDDTPGPATPGAETPPPALLSPPTAEDEQIVREQTLAYLAARDRGDLATARSLLATEVADMLSDPAAEQSRRELLAPSGEPVEREVIRLTWYDNPAGAPRRGRYVAADFRAGYADNAFYCGYALWYLQPDGNFRMIRREDGMLSGEQARELAATQRADMRGKLGCRD